MQKLERRIGSLEASAGNVSDERLIIVLTFMEAADKKREPIGIRAFGDMPDIDRDPGEEWPAFLDRVRGMVAHLPANRPLLIAARYSDA